MDFSPLPTVQPPHPSIPLSLCPCPVLAGVLQCGERSTLVLDEPYGSFLVEQRELPAEVLGVRRQSSVAGFIYLFVV